MFLHLLRLPFFQRSPPLLAVNAEVMGDQNAPNKTSGCILCYWFRIHIKCHSLETKAILMSIQIYLRKMDAHLAICGVCHLVHPALFLIRFSLIASRITNMPPHPSANAYILQYHPPNDGDDRSEVPIASVVRYRSSHLDCCPSSALLQPNRSKPLNRYKSHDLN